MRASKRSVGDITALWLSTAVIILLAAFIILQAVFPSVGMRLLGFKIYRVSNTASMEPMLHTGDMVVVKRADFAAVGARDIIAFISVVNIDGTSHIIPIIHQVVEVKYDLNTGEKSVITSGVNSKTNPTPDIRPVTADGVNGTNIFVGMYVCKIPLLGILIAFFTSPLGIATIVINTLIILFIKQQLIDNSNHCD